MLLTVYWLHGAALSFKFHTVILVDFSIRLKYFGIKAIACRFGTSFFLTTKLLAGNCKTTFCLACRSFPNVHAKCYKEKHSCRIGHDVWHFGSMMISLENPFRKGFGHCYCLRWAATCVCMCWPYLTSEGASLLPRRSPAAVCPLYFGSNFKHKNESDPSTVSTHVNQRYIQHRDGGVPMRSLYGPPCYTWYFSLKRWRILFKNGVVFSDCSDPSGYYGVY